MLCSNCGFNLEPDWIVCPQCSTPLPSRNEPAATETVVAEPRWKRPAERIFRRCFWWACAAIAVTVVGGIYLSIVWEQRNGTDARGSRLEQQTIAAQQQQLATEWLRQAEDCQRYGQKKCVEFCAEEIYRILSAASDRDGIDRKVVLHYWREVMDTGDLGYKPPAR